MIFSVLDSHLIGLGQEIVNKSDHRFTGEPGHDESAPRYLLPISSVQQDGGVLTGRSSA
ncbi:hypothetical protein [Kocuria rosea]|uniref:hypothetical protein n=1 Tax=Kocuria rosea TaxID=1275 RepID=UPI00142F22D9|nr:hypothetical protein [Kocuria rosea]MEB2529299.1 hypothetical protein [Kocuria rosea]MEB2620197.1 hypothetical protein [Kocuria rosea]